MTLRTCPEAISPASPVRPLPALLATIVSSRAPCSVSASMSSSGAATAPKPAHNTTEPSLMSKTALARPLTILFIIYLEGDLVAALELQDIARLGGAGDLEREIFQDGANTADLLGIGLGELALAEIDRILKPDADAAAHHGRHGDERQLMPPGGEDRPVILVAEKLVGDALHVRDVLGIGADAAEDAEDRLHEEWRLDEAAIEEMREVVEVADIVALELEARAAALAQLLQDVFDVLEGVSEDEVARVLEVLALPVVLELLVALEHGEEHEIHRAHVERAHFRLGTQGRGEALLQGHAVAAARGDVHHGIAGLLDARKELHKDVRIRRRLAVPRVARMQVDDRGAGLGRLDRLLGDLVGGQRQIGRHRRGVYRPRDRTGDDDLRAKGHGRYPPPVPP